MRQITIDLNESQQTQIIVHSTVNTLQHGGQIENLWAVTMEGRAESSARKPWILTFCCLTDTFTFCCLNIFEALHDNNYNMFELYAFISDLMISFKITGEFEGTDEVLSVLITS